MAIKIIRTNKKIPTDNLPLVIGYFGCIHVMHQQLLTKYHQFNVLTFSDLISKRQHQIYNYNFRLENLQKYNPKNIYVLNVSTSNMTGKIFIEKILKKINPSSILVGEDFKFGSDNLRVRDLKNYFKVEILNYNPDISTSKIYDLLSMGKIEEANDYLSFYYYIKGKWVGGMRQGRRIGWPTINIVDERPGFIPPGSYVSMITLGSKKYKSITFVGKSETIKHNEYLIETHVIDKRIRARTLYPAFIRNNVKVEFLKFIRPNTKLDSIDKLKEAIENDSLVAKKFFKEQGI